MWAECTADLEVSISGPDQGLPASSELLRRREERRMLPASDVELRLRPELLGVRPPGDHDRRNVRSFVVDGDVHDERPRPERVRARLWSSAPSTSARSPHARR